MLDFGFYNMDCMQGMREFPDKYFDPACEDYDGPEDDEQDDEQEEKTNAGI